MGICYWGGRKRGATGLGEKSEEKRLQERDTVGGSVCVCVCVCVCVSEELSLRRVKDKGLVTEG